MSGSEMVPNVHRLIAVGHAISYAVHRECRFRSISFLFHAPRKNNDRAGIHEHIPQLFVNCVHIFLYFLFLPTQCRCT